MTRVPGARGSPIRENPGDRGLGEYKPWDETQEEPTGMCPNCGRFCYGGDSVCGESCYQEYVAYLADPTGG